MPSIKEELPSQIADPVATEDPAFTPEQIAQRDAENKVIENLKNMTKEYEDSVVDLEAAMKDIHVTESKIFRILFNISKASETTSPTKTELLDTFYSDTFLTLTEYKDVAFNLQSTSYKILQKYKDNHCNFLAGVINGWKERCAKAEGAPV